MQAEDSLSYWIKVARMGFENDLARLMEKGNDDGPVSRSELAQAVGVTPAFVTKVLNGNNNYTLKTMAKFARALGAVLEVRLADESKEVVRVLDVKTAGRLDDELVARNRVHRSRAISLTRNTAARVVKQTPSSRARPKS